MSAWETLNPEVVVEAETKAMPPTASPGHHTQLGQHRSHSLSAPNLGLLASQAPPPAAPFEYKYTKLPFYADFNIEIIMYRQKPPGFFDDENEAIPLLLNHHPNHTKKSENYILKGFSLAANNSKQSTPGVTTPKPCYLTDYTTRYIINFTPTKDVFARMSKMNGNRTAQEPTPYDMAIFLHEVNREFKRRDRLRREEGRLTWDGYIVRHSVKNEDGTRTYRQICYSNNNSRLLDEELNDGSLLWNAAIIAQHCQGEQGKFYWEKFHTKEISSGKKGSVKFAAFLFSSLAAGKAGIGVYKFFNTTKHLNCSSALSTSLGLAGAIPAASFYFDSVDTITSNLLKGWHQRPEYAKLIIRFATKHLQAFPKRDLGIAQRFFNYYFGLAYAGGNYGMVSQKDFFEDSPKQLAMRYAILGGIALTNFCVGTDKANKFTSDVIALKKALKNERNPALEIAYKRLDNALIHLEIALEKLYRASIKNHTPKKIAKEVTEQYRSVLYDAFETNKDCTSSEAVRLVEEQMEVVQREVNRTETLIRHTRNIRHLAPTSGTHEEPLFSDITIKDARLAPFDFKQRVSGDTGYLRPTQYHLSYGLSLVFSIAGVLSNINGVNSLLTNRHINMPAPYALGLSIISVISAIGLNKGSFDEWADKLLIKLGYQSWKMTYYPKAQQTNTSSVYDLISTYTPTVIGNGLSAIQATCGFYYTYTAKIFTPEIRLFCAGATFLSMYVTKVQKCIDFVRWLPSVPQHLVKFLPTCIARRITTPHITFTQNEVIVKFKNADNKILMTGINDMVDYINSRLRSKAVVTGETPDFWRYLHATKKKLGLTSVIDLEVQKKLGVYPYEIQSDGPSYLFAKRLNEALEQIKLTCEEMDNGHLLVRGKMNKLLERELAALSLCALMLDNGKELLEEGKLQRVPFSPETHEPENPPSLITNPSDQEILNNYGYTPAIGNGIRRRRAVGIAQVAPFFDTHDQADMERANEQYTHRMVSRARHSSPTIDGEAPFNSPV